jgi:hypothetical protein
LPEETVICPVQFALPSLSVTRPAALSATSPFPLPRPEVNVNVLFIAGSNESNSPELTTRAGVIVTVRDGVPGELITAGATPGFENVILPVPLMATAPVPEKSSRPSEIEFVEPIVGENLGAPGT